MGFNVTQTNLEPLAFKGKRAAFMIHSLTSSETMKLTLNGNIDSLNVSVACAITPFEAVRQRA